MASTRLLEKLGRAKLNLYKCASLINFENIQSVVQRL